MAKRPTTAAARRSLYAASEYLSSAAERELGLLIPFEVYLQDPSLAEANPDLGFDRDIRVRWEPGLSDGPTSARFAVVDYNGDTGRLAPKARWDDRQSRFVDPDGKALDAGNTEPLQFHQVNVWAVLQRALEYFESGFGLGRPIPFGFEGNRLIVVPHAGYGKNAFYDRASKSLQFYYFDDEDGRRVHTCLSADIIHHEFGHAMLDGVRPYYCESCLVETAAFHEFIGDLSAILILLRNNAFRAQLADSTDGDLSEAEMLAGLAEEFGKAVHEKPYLRTAKNDRKMSDIGPDDGPHFASEVLTGAMFEILLALSAHYVETRGRTARQAFWSAVERMQRMAIQPLDLLPPADVTFRDYALAALRAEELANPTDPYGFREMMLQVFVGREILGGDDAEDLRKARYVHDRLRLNIDHDIDEISRSRAAAYRFLDDNRANLFIPANEDVVVADLYDSRKLTRQGRRLPRQIILEYVWREDVPLEGERFGEYAGELTTMLCGGTLVFDQNGSVLSWFRKPGTSRGDGRAKWTAEAEAGDARRGRFLENLARRIQSGQVGAALGSGKGLLGSHIPPVTVGKQNGSLQFSLSPHLTLRGEDHEQYEGGRGWQVSS